MAFAAQMSQPVPEGRRDRMAAPSLKLRMATGGTSSGWMMMRALQKVNFHTEYKSSNRQHRPGRKPCKTHLLLALPNNLPLFFPFAAQPQ
jgi:hypothetical protein